MKCQQTEKRVTRARAIRLKCIDCCCGVTSEVKLCHIKRCPLWRYRMGREERDDLYPSNKKEKSE